MHNKSFELLTWTCQEVSVQCADETLLVLRWRNNSNILSSVQSLFGFILQGLGKGIATCERNRMKLRKIKT